MSLVDLPRSPPSDAYAVLDLSCLHPEYCPFQSRLFNGVKQRQPAIALIHKTVIMGKVMFSFCI